MTTQSDRSLDVLCAQLTENIMGAALCAQELAARVCELRHEGDRLGERSNGGPIRQRGVAGPMMDESTLSVAWRGKRLHLGHTQGFWLLTCLSRNINRYVTHLDLLQEVWDDEDTDASVIRAGMRRLRQKLREGGMGDLASAIVGHHGRYMLTLANQ